MVENCTNDTLHHPAHNCRLLKIDIDQKNQASDENNFLLVSNADYDDLKVNSRSSEFFNRQTMSKNDLWSPPFVLPSSTLHLQSTDK
ncbi:hypothetical protein SDC9_69788 [bioreactor metagenome]|uniref:Uncharacterized protein n=1 Tax=bioreactor metagenome TaxID=1076179 RepID=A0A644Y537_9ZZZZ